MKRPVANHDEEFQELTQNLTEVMDVVNDPVKIGAMLFTIAEERKSGNLVIREINGKFDNILERIDKINAQMVELNHKLSERENKEVNEGSKLLSGRDEEILAFVSKHERVCADEIKKKFKYRGRNAASARLSRLFKDGLLEKNYAGRKVYYQIKS